MEARYYITPEEYEIAASNGISKCLLNNRVRVMEWTKKKAITEPVQKKGKMYPAEIIEKAKKNGIPYYLLSARIRNGWSIEKASTTPVLTHKECGQRSRDKIRKYPEEYVELAKKNGISYSAFTQRIIKGMSPEEAATKPKMTSTEIAKLRVNIREENRRRNKECEK